MNKNNFRRSITCVITNEKGEILVLQHRKCLNKYSLPAGTVEEYEKKDSRDTAIREMEEELKININKSDLKLLQSDFSYYERIDGHQIYFEDTYDVTKYGGKPVNNEPLKHPSMEWFSPMYIFKHPQLFTYNTWRIARLILHNLGELED